MELKTQGIVIRNLCINEADNVLIILTETHGKLSVISKSTKKATSKLQPCTELFTLNEYQLIKTGTNSKYLKMINARQLKNHENIRKELKKIGLAYLIAELLDKFLPVEEVNEEVFALAKNAFAMLDDKETLEVAAVEMMFKLKLLELSGFDIGADKVFLKNGLTSLKTKDFIEGNRVTEIDASYVKEINSVLDHYIVNVLEEELVSKKMMKDWK
ncbi:MAG: DNA repair protein RecO [bacterium]